MDDGVAKIDQNEIFGKFSNHDGRQKVMNRHAGYAGNEPSDFKGQYRLKR